MHEVNTYEVYIYYEILHFFLFFIFVHIYVYMHITRIYFLYIYSSVYVTVFWGWAQVYIGPGKYFVTSDVGRGRMQWYSFLALPPGSKSREDNIKYLKDVSG